MIGRRGLAGFVAALLAISLAAATASGAKTRTGGARLKAVLTLTPGTALAGDLVHASLTGSTLPRGTTLRKATISWGDSSHVVAHSLKGAPEHRYAHAAKYTVRVEITDSAGRSAVASQRLTVVKQNLYWDLFNGQSLDYQAEYTTLPLTKKSSDTLVAGTGGNGLRCTSGMGVGPQHRLWILSYPSGCSAPYPAVIQVFALPFTASSTPLFTLTLPGTGNDDGLAFDRKGNAWISDSYNKQIYEFAGPFTDNATLAPSLTLSLPNMTPSGLALNASGDLFVSNVESTAKRSIAVYRAPILETSVPSFLSGLTQPGGLTFDKHGNLFASNNPQGAKGAAIVRYDARRLNAGAKPSVVDGAGLKGAPYEANFAWDASGNLYVADCGDAAHVRVYPLATKRFNAKLAPSVTHRNGSLTSIGCAWGIAIG